MVFAAAVAPQKQLVLLGEQSACPTRFHTCCPALRASPPAPQPPQQSAVASAAAARPCSSLLPGFHPLPLAFLPLPRPLAGIGLATSLLSLVAVEPYTTKIMFERYDLENAAVRDNGELHAIVN